MWGSNKYPHLNILPNGILRPNVVSSSSSFLVWMNPGSLPSSAFPILLCIPVWLACLPHRCRCHRCIRQSCTATWRSRKKTSYTGRSWRQRASTKTGKKRLNCAVTLMVSFWRLCVYIFLKQNPVLFLLINDTAWGLCLRDEKEMPHSPWKPILRNVIFLMKG